MTTFKTLAMDCIKAKRNWRKAWRAENAAAKKNNESYIAWKNAQCVRDVAYRTWFAASQALQNFQKQNEEARHEKERTGCST